ELTSAAIGAMSPQFPKLTTDAPKIHTMIDAKKTTFTSTLHTGTAIFDAAVNEIKQRGAKTLSNEQAFQLHDTYGFPINLTLKMASEQSLTVNEDGFRRLITEQRHRTKNDS